MDLTRHLWRVMTAILLIAAFVVPAPQHLHHGAAASSVVAIQDHSGCASANEPLGDPSQDERQSSSHGACCPACAGHVVPAMQAASTFSRTARDLRLAVPRTDVLYPGIVPESLPEPPRPFA